MTDKDRPLRVSRISLIDLPEITVVIDSYLTRQDFVNCICVCKSWNRAFLPSLWSAPLLLNFALTQQPSLPDFARYASWVRHLRLHGGGQDRTVALDYLASPDLCHLANLTISRGTDRNSVDFADDASCNALIQLIRRNPVLTTLRLVHTRPSDNTVIDFWDAVAGCRSLKTLFLNGYNEHNSDQNLWVRLVGLRIERLELINATLLYLPNRISAAQAADTTSKGATNWNGSGKEGEQEADQLLYFPTIKVLRLVGVVEPGTPRSRFAPLLPANPSAQLQLLSLCPNLEELFLTNYSSGLPLEQVYKTTLENPWPHLSSLSLLGLAFGDDDMARILDSFRDAQLVSLSLRDCSFGPLSMAAFEKRLLFERIRTLSLVGTSVEESAETSRIVQRMLMLCPLLESLTADILLAVDVANGQDWACTGLRQLKIEIDLGPDESKTSGSDKNKQKSNGPPGSRENIATEDSTGAAAAAGSTVVTEVGQQQPTADASPQDEPESSGIPANRLRPSDMRQRAVFRQLGRLHQLRVLNLRPDQSPRWISCQLDLDIRHGLELLGELSQLTSLYFVKVQVLGMEDLEWMRVHWGRLENISKHLHPNPERQVKLQQACASFGWHVQS
ncbi:hypothetical protein BGX23_006568 [Mortierella sp. AD031]|nr:hypothetical protein BGX23_006568 [Mortierella sp. AD031]KAG0219017.1 hypothetical protein BGX33_005059 [Mortierella sp. NVP41]